MPVIKSKIDRESDDFQQNAEANRALADDLHKISEQIQTGGSSRARERHLVRGKLLPRDRIDTLTDGNSPFLEIGQMAALGVYQDDVPAAGIVTGSIAPPTISLCVMGISSEGSVSPTLSVDVSRFL